jgi:hypothetical protein
MAQQEADRRSCRLIEWGGEGTTSFVTEKMKDILLGGNKVLKVGVLCIFKDQEIHLGHKD